jgi:uncharacterized protein (DUF427 family)
MERVWEYPRPPAVVPCRRRVRVELAGEVLAESTHALRVLETSYGGWITSDLIGPFKGPPGTLGW